MRILWISFCGKWIAPLLAEVSRNNTVAMIYPTDSNETTTEHGATIYKLKMSDDDVTNTMTSSIFQKYDTIIRDFKPDIIHIHGTEKNIGQVQNYIHDIPIVISIQGIASGCIPFDSGYLIEKDIAPFKTLKNHLGRGGHHQMHRRFLKAQKEYEKEILSKGSYFFCRTNWDKAWITFSNPTARIYHGEELLRQPFYDNAGTWRYNDCDKHTIFMTSGFNPIKGFHIALKALALLKKTIPDIKLVVPGLPRHLLNYRGLKSRCIGEDYVNFCNDIIKTNRLERNVVLLEQLEADRMVEELRKANIFLSPTSIDNSPNSVGEAMMIGLPIVCSPVGGLTSFMKDEENCLLAPAGDEYITAYQIKRLFEDQGLASLLGKAANATALIRHDKETTLCQYLTAYKDIVRDFTTRK